MVQRAVLLLSAIILAGCRPTKSPSRPITAFAPTTAAASSSQATQSASDTTRATACGDAVIYMVDGVERESLCPDDAKKRGLTIVDVAEDWAPAIFQPQAQPGTEQPPLVPRYRAKYRAFAAGHSLDGEPLETVDKLGELYGILPAISVVRARLDDDARHACHAAITTTPIDNIKRRLSQDNKGQIASANRQRKWLAIQLERQRVRRKLPDIHALATVEGVSKIYERWAALDRQHEALTTVQAKMVCEGFMAPKFADGEFTWRTGDAVDMFQRRNFLMPTEVLDEDTRRALHIDSKEHDFRLALRVLRERVVDATGLIEDGTAGAGPQPILGRVLDPEPMHAARGHEPLPDAAPDLVGATTEAAANHLGWTGFDETRRFFARHPEGARVALPLPPPPPYHAKHMEIEAVIDRGDVWYDQTPKIRRVARRPALILYTTDAGGKRRPLVRWPSTIGGWADERMPSGWLVQKWKESDVGPRLWREMLAAPTWTAPKTTPDRDLVKNLWNGRYRIKHEILGPGPRSAYGMVKLVHHQQYGKPDKPKFGDNGIRTHGSSSVTSIVNGTSHGCHRLFNHLAVRLGSFLLAHRDHVVKGEQKTFYKRIVRHKGVHVAKLDTKGFLYELTPPVTVTVLKGKIRSPRKKPPKNSAPAKP